VLLLAAAIGCGSKSLAYTDPVFSDAAVETGSGGLPGFGEACAPIVQQGDPQCATGLVCVSVEQGRNLCTKTCTTAGTACTGAPAGTAPTCGREFQVYPANSRVCEFFCEMAAPHCPPATTCIVNFDGMTTCQPPVQ